MLRSRIQRAEPEHARAVLRVPGRVRHVPLLGSLTCRDQCSTVVPHILPEHAGEDREARPRQKRDGNNALAPGVATDTRFGDGPVAVELRSWSQLAVRSDEGLLVTLLLVEGRSGGQLDADFYAADALARHEIEGERHLAQDEVAVKRRTQLRAPLPL